VIRSIVLGLVLLLTSSPAYATEAEDVVARLYDAYSKWDFDAFMAEFADNAVARTADGSQVHRGKRAIREIYRTNFRQRWPVVRIVSTETNGNRVTYREAYPRDDRETCCSTTEFVVEDGKIVELILSFENEAGANNG